MRPDAKHSFPIMVGKAYEHHVQFSVQNSSSKKNLPVLIFKRILMESRQNVGQGTQVQVPLTCHP